MSRSSLIIVAALSCCTPQPRSSTYFEHHPKAVAPTLSRCASGAVRGEECANAEAASARLQSAERLKLFRRGF